MPEISVFFGIRITMYYMDHQPPHFHAKYGDSEALVDIRDGVVMKGNLPNSQAKLVLAWCEIHRDELFENWRRAKESRQLLTIKPLS